VFCQNFGKTESVLPTHFSVLPLKIQHAAVAAAAVAAAAAAAAPNQGPTLLSRYCALCPRDDSHPDRECRSSAQKSRRASNNGGVSK